MNHVFFFEKKISQKKTKNLRYSFLYEQFCKNLDGDIPPKIGTTYPVGTGRKLNVHKTFRRRPGRLLNVLCTLNLHPVLTG